MARPGSHRAAFTLTEIIVVLIVLGVLAAVVIPQFSTAAQSSRETGLRDAIQYLRTQVTVFKSEHRGVGPGFPRGDVNAPADAVTFVRQMTNCSDELCETNLTVTTRFRFGPYLARLPVNVINGLDGVRVVAGPAMPAPDESLRYGWIYNATTCEFIPNLQGADLSGKPYQSY